MVREFGGKMFDKILIMLEKDLTKEHLNNLGKALNNKTDNLFEGMKFVLYCKNGYPIYDMLDILENYTI